MRNLIKKSGAVILASALMATSAVSAFAASSTDQNNNTATTNDLTNADIIDSSKKGSISIYKYDMTSAAKDNAYEEGSHKATGEADADLENILKDYAVEGVEFTYLRCGDVETYSVDNGDNNFIELVYEIPDGLREILGLNADEAVDMSGDKVAFKCDNTGVYHYTSQQLNDALRSALEENNVKTKDALEDYIQGAEGKVALPLTNKNGLTNAKDMDLGLYLIVETKVPEEVVETVNPWFVQLPFTNTDPSKQNSANIGGNKWLYDATCYPKNQTGNPTLDKLVRNATGQVATTAGEYEDNSLLVYNAEDETKNKGLASSDESKYISDRGGYTEGENRTTVKQDGAEKKIDSNDYGYASTTTASEGDILDYILVSHLPHISDKSTYLSQYTFVDTLSEGIEYNKDARVAFYSSEKDAMVNNTSNADVIWSFDKNDKNYAHKYADIETEYNKKTGQTTMTVAFTDEGLKAINTERSDYYLVVYYTATVNSDATVVLGDEGNPNDVVLTWERSSENFYMTLEDRCYVYTYGINFVKTFSDGKGDPTKVKFNVYDETDDYYVVAEKEANVDGEKVYYVTGKTTDQKKATVFIPDAKANLNIYGLEADVYRMTELETDDGYSLLKNPIIVDIKTASRNIVPSTAGYVGNVNGDKHTHTDDCYAKDANDNVITYTDTNGEKHKILICGYGEEGANGRTIGKVAMAVGDVVASTATVDGASANMSNYNITEQTKFDDQPNSSCQKVLAATNGKSIDSADALVDMKVSNSKGFLLPVTGGDGMVIGTVIGIVVFAIGGYIVIRKKKSN